MTVWLPLVAFPAIATVLGLAGALAAVEALVGRFRK